MSQYLLCSKINTTCFQATAGQNQLKPTSNRNFEWFWFGSWLVWSGSDQVTAVKPS